MYEGCHKNICIPLDFLKFSKLLGPYFLQYIGKIEVDLGNFTLKQKTIVHALFSDIQSEGNIHNSSKIYLNKVDKTCSSNFIDLY